MGSMTFRDGTATFLSKAAAQKTWPVGVPKTILVNNAIVRESASPVRFENHRYSTKNQKIAAGLIRDESNFDKRWGWSLDPASLPVVLEDLWAYLSTEKRIEVALLLVKGEDPESVFETMSDDDKAAPAEARIAEVAPLEFICPVPGCGARVEGAADAAAARTAITEHIRVTHPHWDGELG